MLSIADLRGAAKRFLPSGIFSYVDGAAEDLSTLRANCVAFEKWVFTPHSLVDVSVRRQNIKLFGKTWSMPLGISPMGVSSLVSYDGDCGLARAAARSQVPFILSAASTTPLERVMRENPDTWYQAYLPADLGVIQPLLKRLCAAGVNVLVVTVDVPLASSRENEFVNTPSLIHHTHRIYNVNL